MATLLSFENLANEIEKISESSAGGHWEGVGGWGGGKGDILWGTSNTNFFEPLGEFIEGLTLVLEDEEQGIPGVTGLTVGHFAIIPLAGTDGVIGIFLLSDSFISFGCDFVSRLFFFFDSKDPSENKEKLSQHIKLVMLILSCKAGVVKS